MNPEDEQQNSPQITEPSTADSPTEQPVVSTVPPPPPQFGQTPPVRKSNSRLLVIILVLILLAGIGGIAYVMTSGNSKQDSNNSQTQDDNTDQTQEETNTDTESSTDIRSRDTQRITDINQLHAKLEEYFNENAAYPATFTTATFPGIDAEALVDPNGESIIILDPVADEAAALALPVPDSGANYLYVAYPTGCGNTCTGYVLKTLIEDTSDGRENPYVKRGLNN